MHSLKTFEVLPLALSAFDMINHCLGCRCIGSGHSDVVIEAVEFFFYLQPNTKVTRLLEGSTNKSQKIMLETEPIPLTRDGE